MPGTKRRNSATSQKISESTKSIVKVAKKASTKITEKEPTKATKKEPSKVGRNEANKEALKEGDAYERKRKTRQIKPAKQAPQKAEDIVKKSRRSSKKADCADETETKSDSMIVMKIPSLLRATVVSRPYKELIRNSVGFSQRDQPTITYVNS